jgi:hypothetical protein
MCSSGTLLCLHQFVLSARLLMLQQRNSLIQPLQGILPVELMHEVAICALLSVVRRLMPVLVSVSSYVHHLQLQFCYLRPQQLDFFFV